MLNRSSSCSELSVSVTSTTTIATAVTEQMPLSAMQFLPVYPPINFTQRLDRAVLDLQAGRPILLSDDFDRENEADLIVAAEKIDVAGVARLIRDCSGIVCLCLDDQRIQQLALPAMVSDNQSRYGTAFTVSIEARHGVSTGVSAADRLTTIRAAIAPDAKPEDLARPGHVFPLRAQPGGILQRRGHTEGSVDLMRLAGLQPAAVLCELMNPDGSMARGQQVYDYAATHDIVMLSIAELADHLRAVAALEV